MKKLIIIVFAFAGMLWSCKKKLEILASTTPAEGLAYLKVVDASPAFRQIFNGKDSFNVYVNGIKINGPALSYNSVFPTTTNLYVGVPAGPQSIRLTVNGTLTPDSITLGSFNKNLEQGSYYSLIITDSVLKGNEAKQIFVKDILPLTDTTHFSLRFIHAVMNDTGLVDVYSFRNASKIFSNISSGTVTSFVTLPFSNLSDTLYVLSSATQSEIARVNINGNPFLLNRSRAYTLLYKGQLGVTGTKARALTIYGNQ